MPMQASGTGKNFIGLEVLRFLCAITILVWHYQHFFMIGPGINVPTFSTQAQPFYSVLVAPYNWGNYAVEIFWALSGFIFFWKYASAIHQGRTSAHEFFVLRFSRLYPLHFLTLLTVAGLQLVHTERFGSPFAYEYNDLRHFALQLVFASDWAFYKGLSFNGPVWSISVEVLAYVIFFLLARRLHFTGKVVTAIILGLIVAKMALPWAKDISRCLLYFFIGGGVQMLAARPGFRPIRATALTAVIATVFIAVNMVTSGKVHSFAVISVAVALLFLFLALGNKVQGRSASRLCAGLGNLTYSSYLLHFPVQLAVILVVGNSPTSRDIFFQPWALAAFVAGVLALGHLSYGWVERPLQNRIRARWGIASATSPAAPTLAQNPVH